jgi:branched-chain amino acid transport system substrate-binding protein
MRKTVFILAPAITALCLLLTAGCKKENLTIKIATQSPLSGTQAAFGADVKDGTQLAIEQLSEPLTKMGFKVELAPFDDQANPDTGVANAKSIVSDPLVIGVVGHVNSGVQIPSSEEYHSANLCNVSPANTNPRVTDRGYPEISRVCGRDDVQGAVCAQFAKSKGIKSVYVLNDKKAYGQGIAAFFEKEAISLGIRVVGSTGTDEMANFDSILTPILSAKPEALFFGATYDQCAALFRQARQKGYMGVLLSTDGFDSPDAAKIGGEGLLQGGGTYYSTISGPASAYPDTAKFVTDFKTKFGNNPNPYAVVAYDAAAIMLKGIENAAKEAGGKVPARADVSKAVRAIQNFKGITGTINFNSKGDLATAKYFIIQIISADPAKWGENKVAQVLDIKPPM